MCCAAHFNFRNMKNDNFLFLFVCCYITCIIWLPVLILILTRVCVYYHIIRVSRLLSFCVHNFYGYVMFRAVLVVRWYCIFYYTVTTAVQGVITYMTNIHNIYLNHSPTLPLLGTGGGLDKCNILVGDTIALRGGVALLLGMLTLLNDEDTESIDVFPDRFR